MLPAGPSKDKAKGGLGRWLGEAEMALRICADVAGLLEQEREEKCPPRLLTQGPLNPWTD